MGRPAVHVSARARQVILRKPAPAAIQPVATLNLVNWPSLAMSPTRPALERPIGSVHATAMVTGIVIGASIFV
jgi:hypothetical protein